MIKFHNNAKIKSLELRHYSSLELTTHFIDDDYPSSDFIISFCMDNRENFARIKQLFDYASVVSGEKASNLVDRPIRFCTKNDSELVVAIGHPSSDEFFLTDNLESPYTELSECGICRYFRNKDAVAAINARINELDVTINTCSHISTVKKLIKRISILEKAKREMEC